MGHIFKTFSEFWRAERRNVAIIHNGKRERGEDEEVGKTEKLTHIGPSWRLPSMGYGLINQSEFKLIGWFNPLFERNLKKTRCFLLSNGIVSKHLLTSNSNLSYHSRLLYLSLMSISQSTFFMNLLVCWFQVLCQWASAKMTFFLLTGPTTPDIGLWKV